jgi:hypothetical protein
VLTNDLFRYGGNMTIQFDSGLSVRIPNDQLVVPNLTINPQTGQLVANGSDPELVINSIQRVNENNLPQLGRQFLSSAYLMVNQDADEFTLWSANPMPNEDLVAVDTQNQVVEEFCSLTIGGLATVASSTSTTVPDTTAPAPISAKPSSGKLSGGGIAGTAVGSAAVVAVLLGAIFWLITRRRKAAPGTGTEFPSMIRQSNARPPSSSTNT